MGIKNLKFIISKYAMNGVQEKSLISYAKKKIAIDTSIYMYRFIYKNSDPIEPLVKQIVRLLKNGIIPFYVFDGKPPKEKNEVLDERMERKKELWNKCDEMKMILNGEINEDKICDEYKGLSTEELQEKLEKTKRSIIHVSWKNICDAKELFTLMGIPFIEADGEAETLCAWLSKKDLVSGCLSEDTDILANGGKHFLRNFNINSNKIIEYSLDDILMELEMTYEQFIDMCILCGCDYTCTITNIGVERAYKYIKKYGNIENIIEFINNENQALIAKGKPNRYTVPDKFDYIISRQLLKHSGDNYNIDDFKDIIKINMETFDKNALLEFLKDRIKFGTLRDIEKNIEKYHKNVL